MNELLDQFYTTLEKKEREKQFERLLADPGCDAETEDTLRRLWSLRYETKKHGRPLEDAFLDALTELFFVDSQGKPLLFKGHGRRELSDIAARLGLDGFALASENAGMLMRREYANTVLFFADLGRHDKAYGTGVLNLVSVDEKKYLNKLRRDMKRLAADTPAVYGLQALYTPFCEGAMEGVRLYEQLYADVRNL